MEKFELFRSKVNYNYYFRLKDGNGHTILSSEVYVSKQGCLNGIESVRMNAALNERYDRKNDQDQYSFRLKAASGEVLGASESYSSTEAREAWITTVKRIAPTAPLEDLT